MNIFNNTNVYSGKLLLITVYLWTQIIDFINCCCHFLKDMIIFPVFVLVYKAIDFPHPTVGIMENILVKMRSKIVLLSKNGAASKLGNKLLSFCFRLHFNDVEIRNC